VILDLALATMISSGTAGLLSQARRHQRVIVTSTGTSETPLPEDLGPTSLGQFATRGISESRSVLSTLTKFEAHARALGVLPINGEDEAFVAKLFADNVRKPTTKRVLARRST
jgi:hypothetical protein